MTKLAPEVGPLMREASDQAGKLVREACLLGCRGNKEEESEAETSKLGEGGSQDLFVPQTDSS